MNKEIQFKVEAVVDVRLSASQEMEAVLLRGHGSLQFARWMIKFVSFGHHNPSTLGRHTATTGPISLRNLRQMEAGWKESATAEKRVETGHSLECYVPGPPAHSGGAS